MCIHNPSYHNGEQREADYIGTTARKYKERLTEHITDNKLNRCRTAISKLNQEQEVMIDFKEAKIIKKLPNYQELKIT